jgi:hypothetical protein
MLLLTAALTAVISSSNELDFDVPFADAQPLHVYPSPDGFMVFSTGSKGSSGAGMGIVPGDRLVGVNGEPLSTASLYTALQAKTNTTTVLPLVEEIEGDHENRELRGFVKIEIIYPESLKLRPMSDARRTLRASTKKTEDAKRAAVEAQQEAKRKQEEKGRLAAEQQRAAATAQAEAAEKAAVKAAAAREAATKAAEARDAAAKVTSAKDAAAKATAAKATAAKAAAAKATAAKATAAKAVAAKATAAKATAAKATAAKAAGAKVAAAKVAAAKAAAAKAAAAKGAGLSVKAQAAKIAAAKAVAAKAAAAKKAAAKAKEAAGGGAGDESDSEGSEDDDATAAAAGIPEGLSKEAARELMKMRAEQRRKKVEKDAKKNAEVKKKAAEEAIKQKQAKKKQLEENRVSKAKEAKDRIKDNEKAKIKVEKEKNDWNRQAGLDYWFVVSFDEPGTMGLQLEANSPKAVISFVVPGTPAASLKGGKLVKGDRLVGVNGVDTSEMNARGALMTIGDSEWPRKLKFIRPETADSRKRKALMAEEEAKNLPTTRITVSKPKVLIGSYNVTWADWGGPIPNDCTPLKFELGFLSEEGDPNSCDYPYEYDPEADNSYVFDPDAPIHMAFRGHCTFVEKARIAQSRPSGGLVVIQTADGPATKMPAGSVDVSDLKIPVAM